MIKTPEIPTDNLYKFIAIFGLIIFIYSIYLFVDKQTKFELSIKEFSNTSNIEVFKESTAKSNEIILDEKIRYLTTKIRLRHGIASTGYITDKQFIKIKNRQEFEKDFYELNNLKLKKLLLGDSIFHQKLNNKEKSNEIEHYSPWPIALCTILGLILIIVGFYFWYSKTQKYYDIEIKKSIES